MVWKGGRSVSDRPPRERRRIRSSDIRDGSISAPKIAASSVDASKIKDASIGHLELNAGTKVAAKVLTGTAAGMAWQYSHDSLDTRIAQGVSIVDDFLGQETETGEIGQLGWTLQSVAGGGSITRVSPAITGWKEMGTVTLTTNATSGDGKAITLGTGSTAPLRGPPPSGFRCSAKVALQGTLTRTTAWIGLWENVATPPDAAGSNDATGVGFIVRSLTSGANWFGIVRNNTSETTVDLGVAADTTFRYLGWVRTSTGVQFQVSGANVGSEITTNLPSTTDTLGPGVSVMATSASARTLVIDWFSLAGSIQRY